MNDESCPNCHTYHGSNRACPDKRDYCRNCGSKRELPDIPLLDPAQSLVRNYEMLWERYVQATTKCASND